METSPGQVRVLDLDSLTSAELWKQKNNKNLSKKKTPTQHKEWGLWPRPEWHFSLLVFEIVRSWCWTEWHITARAGTFAPSGMLVWLYAAQSKSNLPEMISASIDNRGLIASDIACHLPTATLKRHNPRHQQLSHHVCEPRKQVVYCLRREKKKKKSSASLIAAAGSALPGAGRRLPWFLALALGWLYIRTVCISLIQMVTQQCIYHSPPCANLIRSVA